MNILDGEDWEVKIEFSQKFLFNKKKKFEIRGINAYPPFWKKFLKAIEITDEYFNIQN